MQKMNSITTFRRSMLVAVAVSTPFSVAAQQAPIARVNVIAAEEQDYTQTAKLPGRIKASTVAEVRPQVSGIIRERLFEEGARVEAGQPLYKIEDDTYAAAVLSAKATVAQQQASYDLATVDARRAEETFAKNVTSAADRDSKVAEKSKAEAALQVALASLKTAEIDLERTTIRAPISGIIGFSDTTTGALVAAQQTTALTTIRALDTIYVDVTQSANDLLRWTAGKQEGALGEKDIATMILPNGQTYPIKGDLRAAEPRVEPTTGMVTLRIAFSNPSDRLLPGLYVEVEIPQSVVKHAVLVPQGAVMRDTNGDAAVWVVEDGKIAVRPVKIASGADNHWVISEGLKPGDKVVTTGFQKAAPGAQVEISQAPADQQSAPVGGN